MNQPNTEENIFCEALELPPDKRVEFLRIACGDDHRLLASVQSLLQLHDTDETFLATPAIGFISSQIDEQPGDRVGCYRLEKQIGEGGFGIVWQAEQLEPIRRRVALKIVKLGMGSEAILNRFDEERQTLAKMNHANIAMVLDAGVTSGGRPFFAMELVEGESLDRFCQQNRLSIDEKLQLFITICSAVQHAHQKGIVHRDIKPSNIVVARTDQQTVPKVIDFGIATAIQRKENQTSDAKSNQNVMVGTPQYMSPEQWRNEPDIDTRSDIYSLGVVLYRLLTGVTPDIHPQTGNASFVPPSLHTRQSSRDSNAINQSLRTVDQTVPQDLDWITAKAMKPNRDDRYQSVTELAMDIQRHVNNQVVLANPGGSRYVLQKFVARNRIAVFSGIVTIAAMIIAIIASTWGMIHANNQRDIANRQQMLAEQKEKDALRLKEIAEAEARKLRVIANVLKKMLPEANPFRGMKSGFQIRQNLDQLLESVDSLSSEPELEADLRIAAARIYENLLRFGWARLQYSKALEIRKEELGIQHPKTLGCWIGIANCNIQLGHLAPAEKSIGEVIEISKDHAPKMHVSALRTLRKIRDEQERFAEAFEIAEQALELAKTAYPNDVFGIVHASNEYSISARKIGLTQEAEREVRKSLAILERDYPEKKFVIANTMHRLAEILIDIKQFDEADQLMQSFVELQTMNLGENDQYVIDGLATLSKIQRKNDNLLMAEEYALDAVHRANQLPDDQIKIRSTAFRQLAKVYMDLDPRRAVDAWEKSVKFRQMRLGNHSSVVDDYLQLTHALIRVKNLDDAAIRIQQAIEILDHLDNATNQKIEVFELYSKILDDLGQSERARKFKADAESLINDQ